MGKVFNITGDCKPNLHYMVNLQSRLKKMKEYVDAGVYFTINRARQYGKTTLLRAFTAYLKGSCYVVSMDFQRQMSHAKFQSEHLFSSAFAKAFVRMVQNTDEAFPMQMDQAVQRLYTAACADGGKLELVELFEYLSDICKVSDRPFVLIIDEADQAAGCQVFLDFLSQLRGYYIDRDQSATFQSVILASVYDIRNMKRKSSHGGFGEAEQRNSPWNIAVDFKTQLSFSAEEIAGMLQAYETEHRTGMDVRRMAQLIYEHTCGYPFLVSRICKLMDEEVAGSTGFLDQAAAWTYAGFQAAVRILLGEKNTLFTSMVNKIYDDPELKEMVYSILFTGKEVPYNVLDDVTETAAMFGFVKNNSGVVVIANRIFETVFYNFFLTTAETQRLDLYKAAVQDKNQFICDGHLNMELLLEKFVIHFDELYGDRPERFKEEDGRRYFLLYLRPIINGTGNYYIESGTRNMERTDVIVDYRGEQMIIELKIWRGNAYLERGEAQLAEYLEHYHLKKGYMLSFSFNKNKKIGVRRRRFGDKILIEAIV